MSGIIGLLKQDHMEIRELLNALENSLSEEGKGPVEPYFIIAERLADALEDHIEREELLLSCFHNASKTELKGYHEGREHEEIQTTLKFLKEILEGDRWVSPNVVRAHASRLIGALRVHMVQEEIIVFPVVEGALGQETLEEIGPLIAPGLGVQPIGNA